MPDLLQAFSCFARIEAYCLIKSSPLSDLSISNSSITTPSTDDIELETCQSTHHLISFKNATVSRSSNSIPVLRELNLSIYEGITMIIGPVGSGKSTLIETILGELSLICGSMTNPLSRVAYCAQTPWIQNMTIRENITGPSEFDQKWYDFTIWACVLEEDLKLMHGGDMRKAGSTGTLLSGGQKQRLVYITLLNFFVTTPYQH